MFVSYFFTYRFRRRPNFYDGNKSQIQHQSIRTHIHHEKAKKLEKLKSRDNQEIGDGARKEIKLVVFADEKPMSTARFVGWDIIATCYVK
jgi:hypothetical protein